MKNNELIIKGARENNLKNVDLTLPKNKLIVITGLSGSGKSSLAFNTIYAEGQRRYLESLSSYVRQFLGGNQKPDVDSIEGLSPSIAIDQKTTSHNPRSTVGTVTEIYDYLRVLFARVGTPICPNNHGPIKTQTLKQIVDFIFSLEENSKIQLLSPIVKQEKGSHIDVLNKLKREGFLRLRINGEIKTLDEEIKLEKNKKHTIEVIVDRIVLHLDQQTKSRISDSVETTLKTSNGEIIILNETEEHYFNESYSCNVCNFSIPELEPRLFSFNSPMGACDGCRGLGFTYEPDIEKMVPFPNLSIDNGAIDFFKNTVNTTNLDWQKYGTLIKHYEIPTDVPFKELDEDQVNILMYGSEEPIDILLVSDSGRRYEQKDYVEGVLDLIKRRHEETISKHNREYYSKYISEKTCKKCKGNKLNASALSVRINEINIIELIRKDIKGILDFFLELKLTPEQEKIAKLSLKEIIDRLSFLINVGLDYLTLFRTAASLSGGEAQRIRLATQIGSKLTGVLYVLDEPSIGLHQKDNRMLIDTLKTMRDLGNTLIVVEHDEETMLESDYIVDIGPGAGKNGGYIVSKGTPEEIMKDDKSITGQYLSKKRKIETPKGRRSGNGKKIILKGASENNLKNVNLTLPLGKFVVVTGVSGSGKSTLILDVLVKAIIKSNFNAFEKPGKYKDLIGANHVDKLVQVSQEPIGRTPRSNPATYVGLFDDIRDVFASVPDAKEKGYSKGRFSFNVKGGRCEKCQGDGIIKIDMHFLPSVNITCEECNGRKYNEETLSVKYKSKSIYDVLKMSIDEATEFFKNIPSIHRKLYLMQEVGLGYLELGSISTSLSGGEAQRIKLAKFLQRKPTGKTLYVLDEPTTGLHSEDVSRLIGVLNKIVDNGDSVLVIEHNLDLIKMADHIIDIGPNGGDKGGQIVASGTPEQVAIKSEVSHTGNYLKKIL